jgi:transposase-like protein
MLACKNCQHAHTVKNGFVRGKQRYQCRACSDNVVLGDQRHSHAREVKKALCLILYSLGKASFGFLTKLLGVSRTTTYYWIRQAAAKTDEPTIAPDIQEIEFDEMWHFIQSKKDKSGSLKPWIVAQGEPWPGYSVVVMLQHSNGSMIRSNIERMVSFIQITGARLPRCSPPSVISWAKYIPMRLHEIIPIRDMTSPV